jgi:hypothetical protein
VPLAPSLTTGWNSSSPYPYTDSLQPWDNLPTSRQIYEHSYASSASSLQALGAFAQDPNYQGFSQHPATSIHGEGSATPLGWNAQTGQVHPFDYGASTILPRSQPALYDGLSTPLNQDTNTYEQAPASQPYQSFPNKRNLTIDHLQSLHSNSYPSAQQKVEHTLLSNSTQAQTFIPAPPSRQRSFASDDWRKLSPPSASAPNGRRFTFGDTFDPERDLPVKPIKQEVITPGKQTTS